MLDYDGYVLNDRRRLDVIFIESIGGLTGPDLAAEAEKNPDRDGETPYDATYGGWTITLRGYVDAGTLETMRSLYSYVLDAFDDVSKERPLWFRWLDWRDFFVDSNALVDYSYDSGSGLSIATDGSGLQPSSTSVKILLLRPYTSDGSVISRYTHGDGETIMSFSAGASMDGFSIGTLFRRTSLSHRLEVKCHPFGLTLTKFHGSGASSLDFVYFSPLLVAEQTYYLRTRAEGDVIDYSIWDHYPDDYDGSSIASGRHVLDDGDETLFQSSPTGLDWGLVWTPNSTADRVTMIDVAAINKGDGVIMCSKAAQVEGDETQVDGRYRRAFAVALRNSSARMVSRKPTVVVSYPTDFALRFPLDGSGLMFPSDGSGLIFGGYLPDEVVNLGRSTARPVVRIHGPMTNCVLASPIDGRMIGVDGSIAHGDFYEFDVDTHTVVDSSGASVYRNINEGTNWFELYPGHNRIIVGADSVVGSETPTVATVLASTDVFTASSHDMTDGQVVVVKSVSGADPISDQEIVYVRDSTTNTFKVSETDGGAAVDVTVDGSVSVYRQVGHVEFVYRHSSR